MNENMRCSILFHLLVPGGVAVAIAAATVSADQQLARLPIVPPSKQPPPSPNTLHRELGRVVTDTDVDEALVPGDVVGAIRDRWTHPHGGVSIYVHLVRRPDTTPRPRVILKGSDAFLL